MMEMRITLARLLWRFEVEFENGQWVPILGTFGGAC
jgi:hypothetical protein